MSALLPDATRRHLPGDMPLTSPLDRMFPHSCVFSTEDALVATRKSALPILPGRVLGNIRWIVPGFP